MENNVRGMAISKELTSQKIEDNTFSGKLQYKIFTDSNIILISSI